MKRSSKVADSNDDSNDDDDDIDASDQFGGRVSKKKKRKKKSPWLLSLYALYSVTAKIVLNYLISLCYLIAYHSQITHHHKVYRFSSSTCRITSTKSSQNNKSLYTHTFDWCELDSHVDTTVAGANCVISQYIGKECDISPYRDDYESITNIPIVYATTA